MKSKVSLINITILFLAIFLASFIWLGLSANPPFLLGFFGGAVLLALVFLFFLNLGFAVFWSGHRMAHLVMSLLVIITVCGGLY
jgi:hypothetical protein